MKPKLFISFKTSDKKNNKKLAFDTSILMILSINQILIMKKIYYKNIKENESKERIINLVDLSNKRWKDYNEIRNIAESQPIAEQASWKSLVSFRKKEWEKAEIALMLLNVTTIDTES